MKKIIYILTFIVLASCVKKEPIEYTLLSGSIEGAANTKLIINAVDRSVAKEIEINSEGMFADTLKIKEGYYFLNNPGLKERDFPVYISLADNLKISIIDSIVSNIEGNGSDESKYLLKKYAVAKKGDLSEIAKFEEKEFVEKAKASQNELETLLNEYSGVSEKFKTQEKRNLYYEYLGKLSNYQSYRSYFYKDLTPVTLSEGFLDEVKAVELTNFADFTSSRVYGQMVVFHYQRKLGEKLQKNPELMKDASFDFPLEILKMHKTNSNLEIRQELLNTHAQMLMPMTNDIETYYSSMMEDITNEDYKKTLAASYEKMLKVAKGQPAPAFVNYENYNGGTTSLSDFAGKYVFIDLWATWCGPCKAEIPFIKKLEKEYHDKNIKFVSISLDKKSAYGAWRKMIEEKEMQDGIQLFAPNEFKSDFVKEFQVSAIPRFVLISPEGKIVESNAPKPSDPRLKQIFATLEI